MSTQPEIFWRMVDRRGPDECWPWKGFCRKSGHGLTSYMGTSIHASRKAWIFTHGAIRGDLCVNHKCDNPPCCNPAHMYLGTRADNMMDLWLKTPADQRSATGRTRVLTDSQIEQLFNMRRADPPATLKECADKFGVHIATICRYITERRRAALAKFHAARMSGFAK